MISLSYFMSHTANATIDIDDIGNCCLKAFTDKGEEFILIIETRLGNTRILEFGPVVPDFTLLPSKTGYSYQAITFSDKKIIKEITRFINIYGVTQVFEVTKEEALEDCRDLVEYMRQDNF